MAAGCCMFGNFTTPKGAFALKRVELNKAILPEEVDIIFKCVNHHLPRVFSNEIRHRYVILAKASKNLRGRESRKL